MANTEQITRIRTRVSGLIDDFGNAITLNVDSGTVTYDAWGEPSQPTTTNTNTVGVTDNNVIARMQLGSQGRIQDGETLVVIKGTETINKDYTITLDGTDYNIMNIEDLKAADITVAYTLTLGLK